MIADKNEQFAFRVRQDATKPEVKAAVELLFKVEVEKVSILNQKGKARSVRPFQRPRAQPAQGVREPEARPGNQLRAKR